jgi:pimeloyl-ACP methyl ester carboxylesterase
LLLLHHRISAMTLLKLSAYRPSRRLSAASSARVRRLTICDRCGHFPFHDDPYRFVEVVERFINSTQAAAYDEELLRRLLRTRLRRIGRIES